MVKKQLLNLFLVFTLVLSMSFVFAQQNKVQFNSVNQADIQEMQQHQNSFENKYNFACQGECEYSKNNLNQTRLRVRTQQRFLFWDVEAIDTYDMDEEGNVIQAKYNFWSLILNQNRLKI